MLDKNTKNKIIAKFKTHPNDTGSPEVQIAILTHEINELSNHLKTHRKDFSSRRGLIKKVSQRRKLIKYLENENPESCQNIIKKLKIRHKSLVPEVEKEIEKEIEKDLKKNEEIDDK